MPEPATSSTFLGSQAAKGAARLLNGAVAVAKKRHKLHQLGKLVSTPTTIDELSAFEERLKTSESAALVNFMASQEFDRCCFEVAALHALGKSSGPEMDAVEGRLSGEIFASIQNMSLELSREIAAAIMARISAETVEALGIASGLDLTVDPATRKCIIANASMVAAGAVRESSGFASLEDRKLLDGFINNALTGILGLYSKTKMPHVGALKNVPLEQIYVAPNVRVVDTGRRRGPQELTKNDVLEACSHTHRCIILGDPGGGKSTTSLRLIQLIAEGQADRTFAKALPVLIVLREWADQIVGGSVGLVEVVENVCKTRYATNAPEGAVAHLLSEGRITLFFDGLDELLETAQRSRVVEIVEGFAHRYPLAPIVVTSRRVGYLEAALDADLFHAVEISGFDRDQQKEYARRWFDQEEGYTTEERSAMVNAFSNETRQITDLASNPLMLSLMCALYSSEHYIPKNRPEVYDKCSQLLFDSWDRNRGIKPALPFEWHIMASLDALALKMLKSGNANKGMSTDELVGFLAGYLKGRRFETDEESLVAARGFIDFCRGRAWVLTEVSADRYAFAHATFMEFFAARQLVKTKRSPGALAKAVGPRVARAEWDVVCQLAVQLFDVALADGSEKVAAKLLKMNFEPKERANLLAFLHRCMSFYVPSPGSLLRIAQETVEHLATADPAEILDGSIGPYLFAVSPENQQRWFQVLDGELERFEGLAEKPEGLLVLVLAPEVFRFSASFRSHDHALELWQVACKNRKAEWRAMALPAHRWVAYSTPDREEVVRDLASVWGAGSLFDDAPILPMLRYTAIADSIIRNTSTVSIKEFRTIVLQNVLGGVALDVELRNDFPAPSKQSSLDELDQEGRDALVLAGMGLFEAVEAHSVFEARSDLLNNLVGQGQVSVGGRAVLQRAEIDLSDEVSAVFDDWLTGALSITRVRDTNEHLSTV